MEALWEDAFTGISYCRARWLLRASEIPGDLADSQVLLSTVTDDIEVTTIVGIARMTHVPFERLRSNVAGNERRSLQRRGKPKGRRGRENSVLKLAGSFDPFTVQFSALRASHPALVRLRERERVAERAKADAAELTGKAANRIGGLPARDGLQQGQRLKGSAVSGESPHKRVGYRRVGAERKGLQGVRLIDAECELYQAEDGASSNSSASIDSSSTSSGSASSSSRCSSSSGTGSVSGAGDGDLTSGDSEDNDGGEPQPRASSYPTVRRTRRRTIAGVEADLQRMEGDVHDEEQNQNVMRPFCARPRRLAMPPEDMKIVCNGVTSCRSEAELAAKCAARQKSQRRGGPLIRAARVGDDSDEDENALKVMYPHREAAVGEGYQAIVPALLTKDERTVDRAEKEQQSLGGVKVCSRREFCVMVVLRFEIIQCCGSGHGKRR